MRSSTKLSLGSAIAAIRLLLAAVLMGAGSARAAVVLIPEIADEDPIEGLRARADLLKTLGNIPGVVIAPLSRFKKLARVARLDPHELSNAKAAIELGRSTDLTAILGGSIEEVYGRRVLRLRVFDRAGSLIYRSNLDLGEGTLDPEARQLLADRLMTALGISETARSPSRVVVARAEEAPVEASDASMEPIGKSTPHLATQEQLRPPPLARFEDPGFQIELGVQGSLLNTSLVDNTQNGSCASGAAGCVSSLGSNLYPGVVGQLETFPFHRRPDALAGLGFIATGSFASIKVEGKPAGGAPGLVGSANDLRIEADLVYRLRLEFLSGKAAIFSPSLGLGAGLQLSRFDPQSSASVPVVALDRFGVRFDAEILEPLGDFVRLVLGADVPVSPTPGDAAQSALQSQSAASDGFGLSCELQGHFTRPNTSGPTASLRLAYSQFNDCFERLDGAGCTFSGSQSIIDFDAMVGWAFY